MTLSAKDFIQTRPDRAQLEHHHAVIYSALINRFEPLPAHLTLKEYDTLTEVGSFLINQGVLVEILRMEFEDEPKEVYVVDIAYEPDAHNLSCLSDGSKRSLNLQLQANSLEHAVKGITEVMLKVWNE